MGRWLSGILSNDSAFGQLMTRIGILIGANLMFLLFSFPLITMGPALAALYTVLLKVLRSDGVINPFSVFWQGFRRNFRQGILCWLLALALAALGYADIRFCRWAGGVFTYFQYGVYVILFILLVLTIYYYPVLAAFDDTIPHLLRNAVFFAAKNPFRLIAFVLLHVLPVLVTVLDRRYQPLYVFLWFTCGFAVTAMTVSSMLVKDFGKYLPVTEDMEAAQDMQALKKQDKETFKDMKKMGM